MKAVAVVMRVMMGEQSLHVWQVLLPGQERVGVGGVEALHVRLVGDSAVDVRTEEAALGGGEVSSSSSSTTSPPSIITSSHQLMLPPLHLPHDLPPPPLQPLLAPPPHPLPWDGGGLDKHDEQAPHQGLQRLSNITREYFQSADALFKFLNLSESPDNHPYTESGAATADSCLADYCM